MAKQQDLIEDELFLVKAMADEETVEALDEVRDSLAKMGLRIGRGRIAGRFLEILRPKYDELTRQMLNEHLQ